MWPRRRWRLPLTQPVASGISAQASDAVLRDQMAATASSGIAMLDQRRGRRLRLNGRQFAFKHVGPVGRRAGLTVPPGTALELPTPRFVRGCSSIGPGGPTAPLSDDGQSLPQRAPLRRYCFYYGHRYKGHCQYRPWVRSPFISTRELVMAGLFSRIGRRRFYLWERMLEGLAGQRPSARTRFQRGPFGRRLTLEALEDRRLLSLSTTPTATLTGLSNPQALAFNGSGYLYVANLGGNTVSVFPPGSTTPSATLTGVSNPYALAFDGSGNLYVLNLGSNVSKFATGSLTPTATLTGLDNPRRWPSTAAATSSWRTMAMRTATP